MEEAMAARYWCHMCSQMVNPIMESEIKCPFCESGFVEEISGNNNNNNNNGGTIRDVQDTDTDFGSDRALSLWAPILLGMMSSPRRRRRFRRGEFTEENDENSDELNSVNASLDDNDNNVNVYHHHRARRHGGEIDLDREFESILRRRRRSSGNILQLLQGIRAGIASEYESSENWERERDNNNNRVIMINPFNQSLVVQDSNQNNHGHGHGHSPLTSLGDYFIGPGLDLLLQHLAENDPNRQGTPPARKEAVEALPTVKIWEPLQCSVCLDDFEKGIEAKEMPCKHKFHVKCLVPWLELHSSCPVCRFELPSDENKVDSDRTVRARTPEISVVDNNGGNGNGNGEGDERNGNGNGNGRRFSFPWPFSGLFSSSSSSSSPSSSASGSQPSENNFYSSSSGSR